MLFNSIEYLIFFPIVFFIYWFIVNKSISIRNAFLLIVSYIFYGWWDWRFLSCIIISSILDYSLGIAIANSTFKKKKLLLLISLIFNLGILGVFKYYNFFIDSFFKFTSIFGFNANSLTLNIILPVGISFYTFQTLSYTIDVYRGKLQPTKDILSFFTFVAFFPQLVAGPIEKASNLLPQFYKKTNFDYLKAKDGTKQILWGFFKKVVIADNCAIYVNDIFANYQSYSSLTLILGVILFAFQAYGDFSGYSDIAIGTARLLGFKLKQNFAFPYFSRDIAEFWRRWHISLNIWFRDYLYIPLGGSRTTKFKTLRNIFLTFTVCGFWHGANFTFIIWGILNALYFVPLWFRKTNRKYLTVVAENKSLPNINELFSIFKTFTLACIGYVFFRSETVIDAFTYFLNIFKMQLEGKEQLTTIADDKYLIYILPFLVCFMLIYEWINRRELFGFAIVNQYIVVRWVVYVLILFTIVQYFGSEQSFMYFQF